MAFRRPLQYENHSRPRLADRPACPAPGQSAKAAGAAHGIANCDLSVRLKRPSKQADFTICENQATGATGYAFSAALENRIRSNTDGASAKNQIAMIASVMAHPADDVGANGTIEFP